MNMKLLRWPAQQSRCVSSARVESFKEHPRSCFPVCAALTLLVLFFTVYDQVWLARLKAPIRSDFELDSV